MLSLALQVGNSHISSQGTADLLLHSYRLSVSFGDFAMSGSSFGRGRPGYHHQRRTASALREEMAAGLGPIVHADYRSARVGTNAAAA